MEQVKGETLTLLSHEAYLPGTHGPSTDMGPCPCLDRGARCSFCPFPRWRGGQGFTLLQVKLNHQRLTFERPFLFL